MEFIKKFKTSRSHGAPTHSLTERPLSPDDDSQPFTDALEQQNTTPHATLPGSSSSSINLPYKERLAKPERTEQQNRTFIKYHSRGRNSTTGMSKRPDQNESTTSQETDSLSRADSGVSPQKSTQNAHAKNKNEVPFPSAIQDPKRLIDPDFVRIYNLALTHRWTRREVYRGVASDAPVFLYCSLMLPWVLAKVMGATPEKTASYMIPAMLRGYSRVTLKHVSLPTLIPDSSSKKPLHGFLLGCMKDWALRKIEEYIDMTDHEQDVVGVEVETANGERMIVATQVYVYSGPLAAVDDKSWDPVEYMKRGDQQKSLLVSSSWRDIGSSRGLR